MCCKVCTRITLKGLIGSSHFVSCVPFLLICEYTFIMIIPFLTFSEPLVISY